MWKLEPDFVTSGKSIAGGVPFGAWGMTDAIAELLTQIKGPDGERVQSYCHWRYVIWATRCLLLPQRRRCSKFLLPEAYAHTQPIGICGWQKACALEWHAPDFLGTFIILLVVPAIRFRPHRFGTRPKHGLAAMIC